MMSFVLGNTAHGAMIFSRLDYVQTGQNPDGSFNVYGVGAQLMERGCYETTEIDTIKSLLKLRREHFGDGVVMIDGGANIGVITVESAREMMGWGIVIAFEPQERIYYALAGNIALANAWNAKAMMLALSDVQGPINVPRPNYLVPASYGSLELADGANEDLGQKPEAFGAGMAITIDGMRLDRLDLLKLDIEGMEGEAIAGAQDTIGKLRPILFVEHVKVGLSGLRTLLDAIDYKAVVVGMNVVAVHKDAIYADIDRMQPAPQRQQQSLQQVAELAAAGKAYQAITILDEVIYRNPLHFAARTDRAALYMEVGRFRLAIGEYDSVIQSAEHSDDPDAARVLKMAMFSRGFANLKLGNLREGFVDFEHRKVVDLPAAITDKPELKQGVSVRGKTILVVGEQGFGDNIMFSRYFRVLTTSGAHVIYSGPPQLNPLMMTLDYIQIHGEHSPPFDCWVRMMSLANVFGTDINSVPMPTCFELPEKKLAAWRSAIQARSASGRLKVGLCWSGSRKSTYDKHRSIPLTLLGELFSITGVDYYSLQLDVRETDRPLFEAWPIIDLPSKFFSFLDTACAIASLDFVVTVDTSVAHLAGSLGIPTLVMLTSYRTYWMWIHGRDTTPWYPSMKSIIQEQDGDWKGVVERVCSEIKSIGFPALSTAGGNA